MRNIITPQKRKATWDALSDEIKETYSWEAFKRLLIANDNEIEKTIRQLEIRLAGIKQNND